MRASPLGYKQTLRLVLLVVLACIGPLLLSVQDVLEVGLQPPKLEVERGAAIKVRHLDGAEHAHSHAGRSRSRASHGAKAAHKPDVRQKATAGVDADGVGVAWPEQLSRMSVNDTISAHLSFEGEVEAHDAGKHSELLIVTPREEEQLHKQAEREMTPIEEEEEEEEKDKKGYRVCAPQKLGPRPTLDGLSTTLLGHANRTDVFVHQGNYQKLLRGAMALPSTSGYRLLPENGERVEQAYKFRSCAVVGNSGALRYMRLGVTIDMHDVVVRLNQAPTDRYTPWVGSKTTFRMLNRLWTAHYANGRFERMSLPMERGVTFVVSRTDGKMFEKMHRTIKMYRQDVAILDLSSRVVAAARKLLVAYRVRLCQQGFGPYGGGSTPSSGYVAAFVLMQLCERLTVYGFGKASFQGRQVPYHYYVGTGMRRDGDPVHSFSSEEALLYQLAREKRLTLCNFRELNMTECPMHDNRCHQSKRAAWEHNLVCGFNMDARQAAVVRDQVLSGRGEIGHDLDMSTSVV